MGVAVPHKIGRHVHRKARPDDPAPPAPAPTGIDYLRLVEQQHTTELADRLRYAPLVDPHPGRDAELLNLGVAQQQERHETANTTPTPVPTPALVHVARTCVEVSVGVGVVLAVS